MPTKQPKPADPFADLTKEERRILTAMLAYMRKHPEGWFMEFLRAMAKDVC